MPELFVDDRPVSVPDGATLLEAARRLGIEIPTLCFQEGLPHHTSCMVCLVEDVDEGRLVPACATPARANHRVSAMGSRAAAARRRSLELLLAEHRGDCEAPCARACPAHADIPGMIRRLAGGDWAGAAGKLRALLPLAGSLARVCPAPCRRACRRRLVDSPIDICALKSAVTEAGLGSSGLPSPPVDPPSGRSVAVVGAGAAGLSAAWFLAQSGHRCLIFDGETDPGGMLRSAIVQGRLPAHVLEADINVLRSTGIDLRFGSRVSSGEELEELRRGFDAVVLATGSLEMLRTLLPPGTEVDQTTGACTREGLFACGNATRAQPSRMAVRAVADGRKAARSVDQFLSGRAVPQERTAFDSRIHSIESADLSLLVEAAARRAARRTIVAEHGQPRPASSWAVEEAIRCLRCDCARQRTCRLRQLATETGVDGRRFGSGERRLLRTVGSNGLSLEDGKCIKCGICVRIAESSGDRPGLAFSGRGSQVRVRVPFGGDLGDAVPKSAGMCVDRCPTGALAWDL